MTRQDIADYVNLPVGSISPACRAPGARFNQTNTDGGVVVVDRRRFESLVSG